MNLKKYSQFIVLILIACLPQIHSENKEVPAHMIIPSHTIHTLYQIMKDVHEVFEMHKINYFVEGGTALGAVRHQGVIPWDDDIDIAIEKEQEMQFKSLIPLFNKLGLKVSIDKQIQGYKIFPKNGGFCKRNPRFKTPWMDVFLAYNEQNSSIYKYLDVYMRTKKEKYCLYITKQELFPKKKYKFGECTVYGPGNPDTYLKRYYGDYWNEAHLYGHSTIRKDHSTLIINLTDEHRQPPQTTDYLINRVSLLLNAPKEKIFRIYVNGVWDLFHEGHKTFLKQAIQKAKKIFPEKKIHLMLNIHSSHSKRNPILSYEERFKALNTFLRTLDISTQILKNAPLITDQKFMNTHKIDLIIHGDDYGQEKDRLYYEDPIILGKYTTVPYTKEISTTQLIKEAKISGNFTESVESTLINKEELIHRIQNRSWEELGIDPDLEEAA